MRDLHAKKDCPNPLPEIQLDAVWHVEADQTYHAQRKPENFTCTYIAIRTLGGQGSILLSSGDTFHAGPNTIGIFRSSHLQRTDTTDNYWHFYWFEFDVPGFALTDHMTEHPLTTSEITDLERCFLTIGSRNPWECALGNGIFQHLLADWLLRSGNTLRNEDIFTLLDKGRREGVRMEVLAAQAGMSERSFRDAVHRITGMAPKSCMLRSEMTAALDLLRTTNMQISEISAFLHYSSPFYFSRVFKKYYGVSPRQLREELQQTGHT